MSLRNMYLTFSAVKIVVTRQFYYGIHGIIVQDSKEDVLNGIPKKNLEVTIQFLA
jgi:hypothetical protein